MIDRLVCADGGNPDPTSTGGKDAARAKALELGGWDYPKHLAGRAYGLVVHGDDHAGHARAPAIGVPICRGKSAPFPPTHPGRAGW